MKYAKKLMVVPFQENVIQSPEQKYIENLVKLWQDINNPKLSPNEKVKLYTHNLIRYMTQGEVNKENSSTRIIVDSI